MSMTPLDIQQKRFQQKGRGVDGVEVERFLQLVASEFETLQRELNTLRDDRGRYERQLEEYRSREEAIKETMITAQRVTEEITEAAKKEADIIVGRAELEAEKLVERAQERLTEVLSDIAEAKRQKVQFVGQVRGAIDTHQQLLKLLEEEDGPGVEETLKVMRRRGSKLRDSESGEFMPSPRTAGSKS